MSYKQLCLGRYSFTDGVYHVTTVTADRARYFLDFEAARSVVQEMRQLQEEEWLESLAWVLMPDHLHWLFRLGSRRSLSGTMKLFKGRSARRINRLQGRSGRVWQRAFYDHAVRQDEELANIARCIVANPIRAGLVERVGQYPFWDAVWV
jgi:REP-associated tyrosine transposase